MGRAAFYEPPTSNFPYKISRRLNNLSVPRKVTFDCEVELPETTPAGVRKSALRARLSERLNEASYPYLWRLLLLKRLYSKYFSQERLERIDRILDKAKDTIYTKLGSSAIQFKKNATTTKEGVGRKKKGWSETEWRKHMEYINHIARPKKLPAPEEISRGPIKPLSELMPRIQQICFLPDFRVYKRYSQDIWYKDPTKVSPAAKSYVPTERVKKLAEPRALPPEE